MAEKMLVTQALDERDLLVKKISDKIEKAHFVDYAKCNEEKVYTMRVDRKEFEQDAMAAYQQIMDLINRYQKIDALIVASNANTYIETSYGSFSIAAAISLRARLRDNGAYTDKADFEEKLLSKMREEYALLLRRVELKNQELQKTAESMRLSILGKESSAKDDKPLAVVDAYVKENTAELVDPLKLEKKMAELSEKRATLLQELDTKIKVSNATTYIEL